MDGYTSLRACMNENKNKHTEPNNVSSKPRRAEDQWQTKTATQSFFKHNRALSRYTYTERYVCICMCTYVYVFMYMYTSLPICIYIYVLFWYLGFCVLHTTPYHIVITNYPYNRYEYLEILIWYLYRARASIWEYLGRDLEHVPYDLGSMSHLLFKFAVSPGPMLCGWAGGVPRVA